MRRPQTPLLALLAAATALWAWSRTRTGESVIARTVDTAADSIDTLVNGPRGIRNNNPGNIERGAAWQGLAADQSGDARFAVFSAPEWGIRAMARIIRQYQARGLRTVRQIINTWAPPSENDTGAYVDAVARQLGVTPDYIVNEAALPDLLAAIIHHENGVQPYPAELIAQGIELERKA